MNIATSCGDLVADVGFAGFTVPIPVQPGAVRRMVPRERAGAVTGFCGVAVGEGRVVIALDDDKDDDCNGSDPR